MFIDYSLENKIRPEVNKKELANQNWEKNKIKVAIWKLRNIFFLNSRANITWKVNKIKRFTEKLFP